MKEYNSTTGGRYIFNEDILNLQELALSITEMFRGSGVNFVLSGCEITLSENGDDVTVDVTSGYAYFEGRIIRVEGLTETVNSVSNIVIRMSVEDGPNIMYADGNVHSQYTDYQGYVIVNQRTQGIISPGNVIVQIQAICDEDDNWVFPNVKTGFFKANGLLNEDVIIDVTKHNVIDLSTPKIFTIDTFPAQMRGVNQSNLLIFNRLTNEEIENGVVAKLYSNELDDFLAGRFSIGEVYLNSNCTFKWAMAMEGDTIGVDVSESFMVRRSNLSDGETARFSLDNEDADNVRAEIGNGEIGLYLLVLSGSVDNHSVCKSYPEMLYFGKCKSGRPERVYKFCKDSADDNDMYSFVGFSQWNSLSADEKALWQATIENGSIDTSKLANGSVTAAKIANNAVTSDKLANDVLICNIANYMEQGVSVLPMGKTYMYYGYPLEVRACRTTEDDLPTLVLAYFRGDASAPEDTNYPNPRRLFVYVMVDDVVKDFVYDGSYSWDYAPDSYKKLFMIPDHSVTVDKLTDEAVELFQRRPLLYDPSGNGITNRTLDFVGLKGPISYEGVLGELGKYVLIIDAPTLSQFENLVSRVETLEGNANS